MSHQAPGPNLNDALSLAKALITCPSVTPAEGGALTLLEKVLGEAGFTCERLVFEEAGTPAVDNLFARFGSGTPHLCFAGHTDVVPPGDEALWRHPPFAPTIADGRLHGRGAVDMKGAIACFVAAALAYLEAKGNKGKQSAAGFAGSISLLITGDEEGPAINGTRKVLAWMAAHGHVPDDCIVGEPTNPSALGEEIKIGRRGSLSGTLTIKGVQGHVAYPEAARNPIPGLMRALAALDAEPLDAGSEHFAPSNLEITSIDVGNRAENVIPAEATARFNVRFNDHHDADGLAALLRIRVAAALEGSGLGHALTFGPASPAFLTEPGPLAAHMRRAIEQVTGRTPRLTTSGGTSDARFIKDYCPVIEFGLVNATIHQVDENTALDDLEKLTAIYRRFLEHYFAAAPAGS